MIGYRPDVDGLRAVAVLAVLAFHAFPSSAPGGFAGVDMFFVISGFLISKIIFDDLEHGRFTFANFYWRRIRRIFPALILVMAACLGLGWLLLLPDEFNRLGRHVAAGAGFIVNLSLWREGGYFDTAAELKPLLHLWSLGVEEQYYLVWPLLLCMFRRHALWMIVALGAASFAINIYLTANYPSAAFYLPVTRFWELLAGSALAWVACFRKTTHSNSKALLGATLVATGFILLESRNPFPGWWALFPVVGTALLISAGSSAWINRTILAHPMAVHVGLISYPLYLWHWPLLVYARIAGGEPTIVERVCLLVLSFGLAWATYRFIEKPIRFGTAARRVAVPAVVASMVSVGFIGLAAYQSMLVPWSATLPQVSEIARASSDWEFPPDDVAVGDTPKTVLFFGDSHMQHYWPRIQKILTEHAAPVRTVVFYTRAGCTPVPGIERKSLHCSRFVDEGFELALRPEVDTVVIAASWVGFVERPDYYKVGDGSRTPLKILSPGSEWVLENFEAALRKIVASGKRVVLVLSSPRGSAFDPKSLIEREGMTIRVQAHRVAVPRANIDAESAPIDEHLKGIASAVGASIVDPMGWFCTVQSCPTADNEGRPLYRDISHLRASFARESAGFIDSFIYLRN
jgi:peptidoglycan/LPS O-acetylase OafA/YrhL